MKKFLNLMILAIKYLKVQNNQYHKIKLDLNKFKIKNKDHFQKWFHLKKRILSMENKEETQEENQEDILKIMDQKNKRIKILLFKVKN